MKTGFIWDIYYKEISFSDLCVGDVTYFRSTNRHYKVVEILNNGRKVFVTEGQKTGYLYIEFHERVLVKRRSNAVDT